VCVTAVRTLWSCWYWCKQQVFQQSWWICWKRNWESD